MKNLQKAIKHLDDLEITDLLSFTESIVDDCISNAQYSSKSENIDELSRCEGLYFSFEFYKTFACELSARNNAKSRPSLKKAQ